MGKRTRMQSIEGGTKYLIEPLNLYPLFFSHCSGEDNQPEEMSPTEECFLIGLHSDQIYEQRFGSRENKSKFIC